MAAVGLTVDAICPAFHPLLSIEGLARRFRFDLLAPRRSLAAAIARTEPHLVIACDEFALGLLERLRFSRSEAIAAAAERSLGVEGAFDVLTSRSRLVALAHEAGVAAPPTAEVASRAELAAWLKAHGAPAFLKLDATFGGTGVQYAADVETAMTVFEALRKPPTLAAGIGRLLRRQELTRLSAWLFQRAPRVTVQKAILGAPANCSAFAWRGEVLAVICADVLQTHAAYGIATHVALTENGAMRTAASAIASRLGLTGVFGLDFMLDGDQQAWLIELNPRPTQISHMPFGRGSDLVAAIASRIGASVAIDRLPLPGGVAIALFPHFLRNRGCETAIRDLPRDQPGLIRRYVPLSQRLALGRAQAFLRKRRDGGALVGPLIPPL
jgi:hypothetical protein